MINKEIYDLRNNYLHKNIFKQTEFFVYLLLSFFLPFMIGHPQLLIGNLVNFFLIRTAQYYDLRYVLAIAFLPSLGVYFAGTIFGGNTSLLIYFLPAIWVSNLLFIYIYKKEVFLNKKNIYLSSLKTSLIKASLLFIVALGLVIIFNFPTIFLIVMGLFQLITAIIGSFLSSILFKIENKNVKKI
jgi:hypothetical protein